MAVFLEALLPRMGLRAREHFIVVPHEGKHDLERSIPRKLRAWAPPKPMSIVLRDQDDADCRQVKRQLMELCGQAPEMQTIVRIVCRELESWYLGDLAAVARVFSKPSVANRQRSRKFRAADILARPDRELWALVGRAQKMSTARAMGQEVSLDSELTCSTSFAVFLRTLQRRRIAEQAADAGIYRD